MAKDRAQLPFCLAEMKGGQATEGDGEEGVQSGGQSTSLRQQSTSLRPSSSAQAAPVVKQRRRLQNQALQTKLLFRRQQAQALRRKCWQ